MLAAADDIYTGHIHADDLAVAHSEDAASFDALDCDANTGTLGQASATRSLRDFAGSGAPLTTDGRGRIAVTVPGSRVSVM